MNLLDVDGEGLSNVLKRSKSRKVNVCTFGKVQDTTGEATGCGPGTGPGRPGGATGHRTGSGFFVEGPTEHRTGPGFLEEVPIATAPDRVLRPVSYFLKKFFSWISTLRNEAPERGGREEL